MDVVKKQAGVKRDIESDTSPEAGEVLAHDGTEGLYFFLPRFCKDS
jgi:hypothetical protein